MVGVLAVDDADSAGSSELQQALYRGEGRFCLRHE